MDSNSDRDPPLTKKELLKRARRIGRQRLEPVSLAQVDGANAKSVGFKWFLFTIVIVAVLVIIFLVAHGHIHL